MCCWKYYTWPHHCCDGTIWSWKNNISYSFTRQEFWLHNQCSILINGKHEPIHAYRKMIGFVPQDDIVHGNLTVEENLWFSANCRLPAKTERADKVLIVERVIEYLGLHAIRGSLVGTVENRGISGGQRKRVNVGLEMVIEPSLLILDEPTSGLDSSTSQLLLRARKREALKGL